MSKFDLDYLNWTESEYVFRAATRCGVRTPKADADFVRIIYHKPRYSLQEAEERWRQVLERRKKDAEPRTLGEWTSSWWKCDRCMFGSYARHGAHMGTGPVPADVLVVAMSPQELGGEVFEAVRARIVQEGLRVYATTLLGCAPRPNYGLVKPVATCMERLIGITRDVRPLTVLALGEIPMRALTRKTGLSDHRRQVLWWEELELSVIATWSPSDIVRGCDVNELLEDAEQVALRAQDMSFVPF